MTKDWIKKRLLGSSTMPPGTGQSSKGPLNVLQQGPIHNHAHKHDGSCCGGHHHGPDHHHHDH